MDSLTTIEQSRLQQCEAVIERGLKTFTDVGSALLEIRDSKLYRKEWGTFEEYCRGKWGWERRHAYRLMDAAQAVENVSNWTQILPTNEAQARPLTQLEPDEQREAWQMVIDRAPATGITASLVLEAAKEIQQERREERRIERIEKLIEISSNNQPLQANRKYNVVYADPPWRYEYSISTSREIENQYPTMSIEDICSLPIDTIAERDCVLFIWATSPKLLEAMQVLTAWGFEYRTNGVWVKDKIGMGYYFRQQHELLLIATRGNIPAPSPEARVSSVIEAPRTDHSKKPEEVYEIIEGMYGDLPMIELFCRKPREGWGAWGNQI